MFRVEHFELLEEALQALGLPFVVLGNGRLLVTTPRNTTIEIGDGYAVFEKLDEDTLNDVRRAYTRQTLEQVARKNRMRIVEDPNDRDHIVMRSYAA